ncbi:DMT family transporter [Holosporaceae bacterium 'Namur']|nr:DMT family transporter [Holosporaceae bacterium 'Namur']
MHKIKTKLKNDKVSSGILLMIVHAIAMSGLYVVSKKLMHTLHPNQVAFLYKFAILIAIIPWCFVGGIKKNLKTNKLGTHVARGTFSIMASLCFFFALSKLNVLDAAAITFLEQALIVSVGVIFFKEQLNIAKIVFILCGLIGTLLIIKPGFQEFNGYYVYLFMALLFWAGNNITIKVLGKTERSKGQLFYVTLVSSLVSFPLALQAWEPIQFWHIKYLAILAICYLIHSAALFKAFKYADISTVMPYDYTRLVFGGILGYIIFREVPDRFSLIGYFIITLGGLYLIQYEARRKYKKTPASIEAKIVSSGAKAD